jgi:methionyl aminopeptidase
VKEFVGHGIGRNMHEEPMVPNYGWKGLGTQLKDGMTIAIEPMVCMGKRNVYMKDDGWTVVTSDGRCAAHFEHTVVVRKGGADILSSFDFIEQILNK